MFPVSLFGSTPSRLDKKERQICRRDFLPSSDQESMFSSDISPKVDLVMRLVKVSEGLREMTD